MKVIDGKYINKGHNPTIENCKDYINFKEVQNLVNQGLTQIEIENILNKAS